MKEIKIGDHVYRCGKLVPRRAFHVMRRIAPIISGGADGSLTGAMQALSQMKDEDVNYVLDSCLQRCERLDPGSNSWHAVQKTPGINQFDDMDAAAELELAVNVIQDGLERFLATAQQATTNLVGQ